MLKNVYFWEKTVIFSSASGAPPSNPRLRPPAGGWGLLAVVNPPAITTLYSSILIHTCVLLPPKGSKNNYSKCSAFASSALFAPIFTLNSVV